MTAARRSAPRVAARALARVLLALALALAAGTAWAQDPGAGAEGDEDPAAPGVTPQLLLASGALRESRGEWDGAELVYRNLIQQFPKAREAQLARARLAALPSPAWRATARVARLLFSGPCLLLLGIFGFFVVGPWLYHRADTWRAAGTFLRSRRLELANPVDAGARFQLAHAYFEAGRARKAEPFIREAIRIARENPIHGAVPSSYLRLLGRVCLARGQAAEALTAFDAALAAPSDLGAAEGQLGRGKALERLGRRPEARACYRAALDANSSLLEAYWRLAVVARRLGDATAAAAVRADFARTVAGLPRRRGTSSFRWRVRFLLFPLLWRLA